MCKKFQRFLTIALLTGTSSLATAQLGTSANVFLGYSTDGVSSSTLGIENGNRTWLDGWNASLEVKLIRWVGVVADFSGHYRSGRQSFTQPTVFFLYDSHEHDLLFGPRISATFGRARPFAEGLFGVGLLSGTTDSYPMSQDSFAFALGGGVDYRLIKPLAVRVQGDYVRTNFFNTSQNDFRLSTGLVLRF